MSQTLQDLLNLVISLLITWVVWKHYAVSTYPSGERYSTLAPRIWAGPVDSCVVWPVSFIGTLVLARGVSESVAVAILIVESLVWLVYTVSMHARYGQTVGKMVTKVRVVDFKTEGKISWRRALLRESIPASLSLGLLLWVLVRISEGRVLTSAVAHTESVFTDRIFWVLVSLPMWWFLAEVITMLTNPKRRALHDFIAGTVVVRTNCEPSVARTAGPPAAEQHDPREAEDEDY